MADPLWYYGRLLLAEGKPDDALIPLERALRVREKVLGGQRHNEIAVNLVDIAQAKERLEGRMAAEPLLRRALAIQREVLCSRTQSVGPHAHGAG